MSDLHDARVEEIAKVMADMNGEPRPGRYERTLATVALKNADAAVTVEMITEAIAKVTDMWDEPLDEVYDIPPIARAILDLIRGETETSE